MIKKLQKHTKRVLLVALAIPTIVFAVFCIWVATGPRSLNGYIPQIEMALSAELRGYEVKIAEAQLAWGGLKNLFTVKLTNVRVLDESAEKFAKFPEIETDFKLLPLLFGNLQPKMVYVADARFNLAQKKLQVQDFMLDFSVAEGKLLANFFGHISLDGLGEKLHGAVYESNAGSRVEVYAQQLPLEKFSKFLPQLAGIDLRVDAKASLDIEGEKLSKVQLAVSKVSGQINSPELVRGPISLAQGKVVVDVDIRQHLLTLSELQLGFVNEKAEQTFVSAAGTATAFDNADFTAKLDKLAIEDVDKFWPKSIAPNAIAWMDKSLKNGKLSNLEARFNLRPWYFAAPEKPVERLLKMKEQPVAVPVFEEKNLPEIVPNAGAETLPEKLEEKAVANATPIQQFPDEALDLSFDFDELDVNYSDKFLPVKAGKGNAKLNASSLLLNVDDAKVGNSNIKNTEVKIAGIGVLPVERLTIKGDIDGELATLVDFYEKAKGAKALAKAADVVAGTAKSKAEIGFDLLNDLKLDDISLALESEVSAAELKNFMDFAAVKNANLKLSLTDAGHEISGQAELFPALSGEIVSFGATPLEFVASQQNAVEKIDAKLGLKTASISYPDLDISKPEGVDAAFKLSLRKPKGGDVVLDSFAFDSAGMKAAGTGELRADFSDFNNLKFSELSFGRSVLHGRILREDGYKAYFTGNYLNVDKVLDSEDKNKDPNRENVYIELNVAELGLAAGKSLRKADVSILCKRDECDKIKLTSDKLQLNKTVDKIQLSSNDAGHILQAFEVYDNMVGGKLELSGDIKNKRYVGKMLIQNFSIVKSKFLLGLLRLGSLTGIADLLTGNGISFDKLTANFDYEPDVDVKIAEMRMKGSAIGITADGKMSFPNDAVDFEGKIIPAYSANTLLGEVPVLGKILIGEDGVFALAYSVKGTSEKPEQSVNPLSVLAPGFLQKVFE